MCVFTVDVGQHLVRDIKYAWDSHTNIYLVRFHNLKYSARNLFLSTSKYDLMIIFQNISNLSFKIERFIYSSKINVLKTKDDVDICAHGA